MNFPAKGTQQAFEPHGGPLFEITLYILREAYYYSLMIKSFRCRDTATLFDDRRVVRFQAFERQARCKLLYLHRARTLQDLRQPPGNQLEALKGDRQGQYSIRINDQWRICFSWENGDVSDVEIADYH